MSRIFDIIMATIGLMIAAPLLLLVAIAVKLFLGSPVLFIQERPGLNEKLFKLIKFRTMRDVVDAAGNPQPDEYRMTRFGSFLRKTSLDELPELWNVLRGDMSFVGPRPLLVEYLALYSPEQRRRHEVRPGITGWAQVNGRNTVGWEDRFKLDLWYVENKSFWLDMKILIRTVAIVFRADDIAQEGHVTQEKFRGTKG